MKTSKKKYIYLYTYTYLIIYTSETQRRCVISRSCGGLLGHVLFTVSRGETHSGDGGACTYTRGYAGARAARRPRSIARDTVSTEVQRPYVSPAETGLNFGILQERLCRRLEGVLSHGIS